MTLAYATPVGGEMGDRLRSPAWRGRSPAPSRSTRSGAASRTHFALRIEPVRGETAQPVRAQPKSPARRATPGVPYRTCSTTSRPWGNGRNSSPSGRDWSSHAAQSERSKMTICRSWIGTTPGPGSVVNRVKASGTPSAPGRQIPAKQNHASPARVNRHFDFGDLLPVNSKKCDAGTRQRPGPNRRPSLRKLMTGGALGRLGAKPQRSWASSTPFLARRMIGAVSVGQISSRGSRLGIAPDVLRGSLRWLNSST